MRVKSFINIYVSVEDVDRLLQLARLDFAAVVRAHVNANAMPEDVERQRCEDCLRDLSADSV